MMKDKSEMNDTTTPFLFWQQEKLLLLCNRILNVLGNLHVPKYTSRSREILFLSNYLKPNHKLNQHYQGHKSTQTAKITF